jgi:hypothetical protein
MATGALLRWVLARVLRSPVGAVAGASLLALPALLGRLTPFGLFAAHDPASRVALAWCFPVGLVGAGAALAVLSRGEAFLSQLAPAPRFRGELLALAALPLLGQLLLALGALLARSPAPLAWQPAHLIAVPAMDLALAALALLALRLAPERLGTAVRTGLFLGLAWIVPALAADGSRTSDGLRALDASRLLRDLGEGSDPGRLAAALATVLGLVLLPLLLPHPPAAR